MAFQIEHFDNAFKNGVFSETFHHEHRFNVSHWTARSLLDRALNILDVIAAHASIMCTKSRTVEAKRSGNFRRGSFPLRDNYPAKGRTA
jgi:hypothetical protein